MVEVVDMGEVGVVDMVVVEEDTVVVDTEVVEEDTVVVVADTAEEALVATRLQKSIFFSQFFIKSHFCAHFSDQYTHVLDRHQLFKISIIPPFQSIPMGVKLHSSAVISRISRVE